MSQDAAGLDAIKDAITANVSLYNIHRFPRLAEMKIRYQRLKITDILWTPCTRLHGEQILRSDGVDVQPWIILPKLHRWLCPKESFDPIIEPV